MPFFTENSGGEDLMLPRHGKPAHGHGGRVGTLVDGTYLRACPKDEADYSALLPAYED